MGQQLIPPVPGFQGSSHSLTEPLFATADVDFNFLFISPEFALIRYFNLSILLPS